MFDARNDVSRPTRRLRRLRSTKSDSPTRRRLSLGRRRRSDAHARAARPGGVSIEGRRRRRRRQRTRERRRQGRLGARQAQLGQNQVQSIGPDVAWSGFGAIGWVVIAISMPIVGAVWRSLAQSGAQKSYKSYKSGRKSWPRALESGVTKNTHIHTHTRRRAPLIT